MNYTITHLDRRHAWHKQFSYMIEFRRRKDWDHKSTGGVLEFDQCRKWFNEAWGWSQDVETRNEMLKAMIKQGPWNPGDINQFWSYSIRYDEYRIYVNDAAMSLFRLKWSPDAAA
jgi:hypothetical protein